MKAQNKQSIFDLSGQYFGDLNHIISLAVGNDLTLNQEIPIDQELIINNPVGIGNDKNKEAIVVQRLSFNNDAVMGVPSKNFNKWCLPSLDELNQMYVNLHLYGVGSFASVVYYTSTEIGYNFVKGQSFSTGAQLNFNKTGSQNVRACRSFTTVVGAYSLRDIGPGGGLIFYIDGITYYEAGKNDLPQEIWSNILTEIGASAQGTAIGTGEGNTAAIIGQSGHTTSAAKLCDDLN